MVSERKVLKHLNLLKGGVRYGGIRYLPIFLDGISVI